MDNLSSVGPPPEVGVGGAAGRGWRWRVVAAVLSIVVCMPVGAAMGVLGGLFAKGTADASRGGATPTVAAFAVVNGLRPLADEDLLDLLPFLCDEQEKELLRRLRAMREDLAKSKQTTLEASEFKELESGDGMTVSVMVQGVTAFPDRGLSAHGTPREWRFQTRDQLLGWTVCGWDAPQICGTYVRC